MNRSNAELHECLPVDASTMLRWLLSDRLVQQHRLEPSGEHAGRPGREQHDIQNIGGHARQQRRPPLLAQPPRLLFQTMTNRLELSPTSRRTERSSRT